MTAPRSISVRRLLLVGSALSALAVAGPGGKARAQAFDATPTTVTGIVMYDRGTPGVETITVTTNNAIILWTPPPSPLDPYVFLPAGNVATFQNADNLNFAVLNRIAFSNGPSRFDGTVISQLIDGLGTATRGGTILFQSPGGIIIGSSARFDVGNLVLTTLDVATNAAGDFFDPSGLLSLNNGGGFPNALIQVEPGAQILAPVQGSYVIMAAPRIDQGGLVRVNGSVGYIAASSVDLRVNAGLFDIFVNVGTDNATPILHGGTTGGPASTGAGDVHRIYMVATPSNQAITASLLGTIGYDAAVSATVENGQIVLSGGYQVAGGDVLTDPPPAGTPAANFQIAQGQVTSDLFGFATGDMLAGGAPAPLDFAQDVTLFGAVQAGLAAAAGQTVTVGGNATILSPGGQARIAAAPGGFVALAGNVLVDASVTGSANLIGDGSDETGGLAEISADGATITIAGNADVRATGTGGSAPDEIGAVGRGGNGIGGFATVAAQNDGSVAIGGNLAMDATGTGGFTPGQDGNFLPVNGGNGSGGAVQILGGQDSDVTIAGSTSLVSNGAGGRSGATNGGTGTGGNVSIRATGGAATLTGPTAIAAAGTGGQGQNGGFGQGGNLFIGAFRGSVTLSGAVTANLAGTGGVGLLGGQGGTGVGGNLLVLADADAGSVTAPSLDANADGNGGAGGDNAGNGGRGGDGQGGNATLITTTDFAPPVPGPGIRIGTLNMTANGRGGTGGASANAAGGAGGNGTGGGAGIRADLGPVTITATATLAASGFGGAGGNPAGAPGTGGGGSLTLFAAGPGGLLSAPVLTGTAGGFGPAATGNIAGAWNALFNGGAMNFTTLSLLAPVAGTAAAGPVSTIDLNGGALNITGAGTFSTQGDILLTAAGAGLLTGGTLTFASNRFEASHSGRPANSDTIAASSLAIQSATDFVANAGTSLRATNAINVVAGGNSIVSGSMAASNVTIQSTGNFTTNAGSSVTATNAVSVTAGGAASVSGAVSGPNVTIQSNGNFAANAGSSISATNAVSLAAGGAASVSGAVSGSSVSIQSTGNFAANASSSVSATNAVNVTAGGAASVSGSVSAPNVTIQAGGNFAANAGSSIAATTGINLTAGGSAIFAALVVAPAITVRSSDIDIGAGGFLGNANTQTVNLVAAPPAGLPFAQVVIGGTAQGPGYTLTNAEANRIRAATLNIQTAATGTLPGRPPDLLLRDLALTGSGGGVNILQITVGGGTFGADGIAQVEGNVLLANAAAGDGIFLTAAQRIQIVNPQGSIRVRDATGLPGGTLTLTSNNIWSASQALIGQLLVDANFAGRNDALLANAGPDAPRGYIEAADVTLAARDTLLVQNSGTATDFAGITVVQNTLTINPTGGPLDVYAFGRRINPDGTYVTNKDFFGEVVFGGPGVVLSTIYQPDAAFNNCPIVGALCRIPDNPLPGGPDPFIGPTGGSDAIVLPPPPADDLVDTSFSNDPLIEEPVTSGSENILWDCRDENRDGKCDGRNE
ncbi:MAG TPA: hypothetical protein VIT38_07360 [Allosphingosinicella sp.]